MPETIADLVWQDPDLLVLHRRDLERSKVADLAAQLGESRVHIID